MLFADHRRQRYCYLMSHRGRRNCTTGSQDHGRSPQLRRGSREACILRLGSSSSFEVLVSIHEAVIFMYVSTSVS